MVNINVAVETRDLTTLANNLSAAEVAKATNRAINYALRTTRTKMKREVTNEYNLPSSSINNETLKVISSRQSTLTGTVDANIYPESLGHFGPSQMNVQGYQKRQIEKKGKYYTGRQTKKSSGKSGVFVSVVKGRPAQNIKGAFIILNNNKPLVMARGLYHGKQGFKFGKKRLPITALNTKSVYWGIGYPKAVNIWSPFTMSQYIKEVTRQFNGAVKF